MRRSRACRRSDRRARTSGADAELRRPPRRRAAALRPAAPTRGTRRPVRRRARDTAATRPARGGPRPRARARLRARADTSEPVAAITSSARCPQLRAARPSRPRSGLSSTPSWSSTGRFWRDRISAVGPSLAAQRRVPGRNRLARVGRPPHVEVRDRAQRGELFDRLVRRSVLADEDRVVREDVDDRLRHQRREPDAPAHVVAEDQERGDVRPDAAVQRQPVRDRAHAVLAHAEVEVPPDELSARDRRLARDRRVVRAREIGRAADQRGHASRRAR